MPTSILSSALTILNRSFLSQEISSGLVSCLSQKPRRNQTSQKISLKDPIEVILAAWVFAPFVVSWEKRSISGLDLLRGAVIYNCMLNNHALDGLEAG